MNLLKIQVICVLDWRGLVCGTMVLNSSLQSRNCGYWDGLFSSSFEYKPR